MKTRSSILCRHGSLPWTQNGVRKPITSRCLSTTPTRNALGPESPSWIELPQAIQPARSAPPPVKGILPVPRAIIESQRHKYKSSNQHHKITAPAPKEAKWPAANADRSDQMVHLQSMAAHRRDNLKEGLQGVHQRRVRQARADVFSRVAREKENHKARIQPDRTDEILTQQSVPEAVREALAWVPKKKKLSLQEKAERKAKYDACVEERIKFKMDCVHNLYMNAHRFIIDEKQLNTRIEEVFGEDDNPVIWDGRSPNVWAVGNPLGTADLVKKRGDSTNETDREAMMKRMMQIAGALTGGKIKEAKREDPTKLI